VIDQRVAPNTAEGVVIMVGPKATVISIQGASDGVADCAPVTGPSYLSPIKGDAQREPKAIPWLQRNRGTLTGKAAAFTKGTVSDEVQRIP
jgi:hypothetical protein